jgi:dTDP-glucose 4,6-dehydratase
LTGTQQSAVSSQLAPPSADVLLGRPEFSGDLQASLAWLRQKRVLITGAAGSIGLPLARALAEAGAEYLVLLDHHEYSLFSLERALGGTSERLHYELIDVVDGQRLERSLERHQPEVILHLAAAKHVQYGERFPEGAVSTNVLATQRLLELASVAGVERFVYPSSDKSVGPPGLYGATKRLAEALVQSVAGTETRCVVRYVNIIGTRGSVVETFTQQVLDDRPLSVTDERMTRYWISMDEALWCLLKAAECAAPADVLLPACGEPVSILDTAKRIATHYRGELDPYPIRRTGIRPGERLHEVLLSPNEWVEDGPAPGVRRVRTTRDTAHLETLPGLIGELRELTHSGDRARLRQRCMEAAEALQ